MQQQQAKCPTRQVGEFQGRWSSGRASPRPSPPPRPVLSRTQGCREGRQLATLSRGQHGSSCLEAGRILVKFLDAKRAFTIKKRSPSFTYCSSGRTVLPWVFLTANPWAHGAALGLCTPSAEPESEFSDSISKKRSEAQRGSVSVERYGASELRTSDWTHLPLR